MVAPGTGYGTVSKTVTSKVRHLDGAQTFNGRAIMATKEWREKNRDKLRKYRNRWYAKNRKHQIARQILSMQEKRRLVREWIAARSCADCGLSFAEHPEVAEFHHLDPSQKTLGVIDALKYGKRAFEEEMAKCVLICANCHRIRHSKNTTTTTEER